VLDRLIGISPGDYVSADILVMLNIPSREGYRYALHAIDHASKFSWVYPLKTRETKELLPVVRRFVEEDLPLWVYKDLDLEFKQYIRVYYSIKARYIVRLLVAPALSTTQYTATEHLSGQSV
jgi:hypothetical protein